MKLGLLRAHEYPEAVRSELQQLCDTANTSFGIEHDDQGRQRQIGARWNLGTDQSLATATFVRLVCQRPEADNEGDLAVTSVGVVLVTTPGRYLVQGQVRFEANATGLRGAQILRNRRVMAFALGPVHSGAQAWVSVSETFPCDKGTTIEFEGLQTSGGALSVLAATGTAVHHTFLRVTRVA